MRPAGAIIVRNGAAGQNVELRRQAGLHAATTRRIRAGPARTRVLDMYRQGLNEYRSTSLVLGLLLAALALIAAGCAGSTVGSGVGDRMLQRPPYYAGNVPREEAPLFHLPVQYQRGATDAPAFDPSADPDAPVTRLLADMNAFLDSLDISRPLLNSGVPGGAGPDVQFRCEAVNGFECESVYAIKSNNTGCVYRRDT
jgi:hypothetical protein